MEDSGRISGTVDHSESSERPAMDDSTDITDDSAMDLLDGTGLHTTLSSGTVEDSESSERPTMDDSTDITDDSAIDLLDGTSLHTTSQSLEAFLTEGVSSQFIETLNIAGFEELARALEAQTKAANTAPLWWKEIKSIGHGGFGSVSLVETDKGLMARKKVRINSNIRKKEKHALALRGEMKLLSALKHERIVRYYGTEGTGTAISIFIEYMPKGSIADLIRKQNAPLSVSDTRKYTRQILEGLAYLHRLKIVHRDIKGGNVLCDENGNIKLADFGIAKRLTDVSVGAKTPIGTHGWSAPEVFMKDVPRYGITADIWSVGCTIVEMLTCDHPAYDPYEKPVELDYQLPCEVPVDITKAILDRCLQFDHTPGKLQIRPTAQELLDLPFCKDA